MFSSICFCSSGFATVGLVSHIGSVSSFLSLPKSFVQIESSRILFSILLSGFSFWAEPALLLLLGECIARRPGTKGFASGFRVMLKKLLLL